MSAESRNIAGCRALALTTRIQYLLHAYGCAAQLIGQWNQIRCRRKLCTARQRRSMSLRVIMLRESSDVPHSQWTGTAAPLGTTEEPMRMTCWTSPSLRSGGLIHADSNFHAMKHGTRKLKWRPHSFGLSRSDYTEESSVESCEPF